MLQNMFNIVYPRRKTQDRLNSDTIMEDVNGQKSAVRSYHYTYRSSWLLLSFLLFSNLASTIVTANDNGVGLTPPMGWNSWNKFGCEIHEGLIKDMAHAMVDTGLLEVGYEYVNLDDCWQVSRDVDTDQIQADPTKFFSGIPALRDFVHALGLKFGLYSDAGKYTCQRRPGSLGHEDVDARTYAEWRIDYLKYDNCYATPLHLQERYQAMHDALNKTGHAIFFSMCEWGVQDPAKWAGPIGNSWRTTGDINASWKSITTLMDKNDEWHEYAGPGGWNDPDMLEVGNGDLTLSEQQSHFTIWCLMKAPLLLGNDLRSVSDETLAIIKNTEVIALNQDPLGVQGYKRTSNNGLEVWAGPLSDGHVAVVLFNRADSPANITAHWKDIGLDSDNATEMTVRDLWAHQDLGVHTESVTALVGTHGVAAYRLAPVSNVKDDKSTKASNMLRAVSN